MNAVQQNQFDEFFDKFLANHPEGFVYLAKDPATGKWSPLATIPLLRKFTELYVERYNSGAPSESAFGIVLNELIKAGDLRSLPSDETPKIPADVFTFIRDAENGKISTYELRRKYMSDRNFRNYYDQYTGLAQLVTPQPIQLTADEYHRIPSRTAQARYQKDPAFKASVDKLIADGKI